MIVFAEQSLSKRREGKDKHKIVKDVGIEESYRQIDEEFPTAEQVYRTQTHNEDTDCANAEAETQ